MFATVGLCVLKEGVCDCLFVCVGSGVSGL